MRFYRDKFKQTRKYLRWSIIRLSEESGISVSSLVKWEAGATIPSEKSVRKLARFLQIPVSSISELPDEHPISKNDFSDNAKNIFSKNSNKLEEEIKQHEQAIQVIKQIDKKLLQTSTIIKALLSSMESIFYIKDTEQKYIAANDTFLKHFDIPPERQVEGKKDSDIMTLQEAKINSMQDGEVLRTGKGIKNVEAIIPGSRQKRWGLISKQPVLDSQGRIEGITCNIVDITEQKKAEARLLLEEVLTKFPDDIWLAEDLSESGEFKFLFMSDSVKEIFGFPKEDFYENPELWLNLILPEDLEMAKNSSLGLPDLTLKVVNYRIKTINNNIKHIQERLVRYTKNNRHFLMGVSYENRQLKLTRRNND